MSSPAPIAQPTDKLHPFRLLGTLDKQTLATFRDWTTIKEEEIDKANVILYTMSSELFPADTKDAADVALGVHCPPGLFPQVFIVYPNPAEVKNIRLLYVIMSETRNVYRMPVYHKDETWSEFVQKNDFYIEDKKTKSLGVIRSPCDDGCQ